MEDWQKKIIRDNKARLLELIDVNVKVVAALESKGLISPDDAETLKNPYLAKSTHRDLLLAWIIKKDKTDDENETPAFDYFIQILRDETQSGAANLLQQKRDEYLKKQAAKAEKLQNIDESESQTDRLERKVKKCRPDVKPDSDQSSSLIVPEHPRLIIDPRNSQFEIRCSIM